MVKIIETHFISKYKVIKVLKQLCKSYECYTYTNENQQKPVEEYDEYDFMMAQPWKEAVEFIKELEKDES